VIKGTIFTRQTKSLKLNQTILINGTLLKNTNSRNNAQTTNFDTFGCAWTRTTRMLGISNGQRNTSSGVIFHAASWLGIS
jgi:hypothetical protein